LVNLPPVPVKKDVYVSSKPTIKHRVQKAGGMVSVKSKDFLHTIKANASMELVKTLALGACGALLYPLVPTLLQAATGSDWSGYKGLVTGVGLASFIGLATGRPEITVGACSAAGTHLLYSKGTGAIERTFNTQIFRMNPENVLYTGELLESVTQSTSQLPEVTNSGENAA
jgi:hypothetical protein